MSQFHICEELIEERTFNILMSRQYWNKFTKSCSTHEAMSCGLKSFMTFMEWKYSNKNISSKIFDFEAASVKFWWQKISVFKSIYWYLNQVCSVSLFPKIGTNTHSVWFNLIHLWKQLVCISTALGQKKKKKDIQRYRKSNWEEKIKIQIQS